MTRSMWLILGAVLLLSAGIGWYFGSPLYTLSQMKSAAEANDSDALASYIDFPSLREDLKGEFRARMVAEGAEGTSGLGALGIAMGTAMVGPMIDGMVTPEGVRAALIANQDEVPAAVFDPATAPTERRSPLASLEIKNDVVIKRRGLSEFIASSKENPGSGMVFTRHGLGWKLSGVDLPEPRPGA